MPEHTRPAHPLMEYFAAIESELDTDASDDSYSFTKESFLHAVIRVVEIIDDSHCVICGVNTSGFRGIGEYYMVHDDIWKQHGCHRGMLCIGCLESRLGRFLVASDFTDCPVNRDDDWIRSVRLQDRLSNS